jgi:hypothetical protein
MKIIKLAILSIILLFLLLATISLFLPSNIRITKTQTIYSDKEKLMEWVSDPLKWKQWYPGLDTAKAFYEAGLVTGLSVNEEKKQAIIITEKRPDEIDVVYRISGEKKMTGGWKLLAQENAVVIQWYITLHVSWYPWEKFAGLIYEKSLAGQMNTGLEKLKQLAETK